MKDKDPLAGKTQTYHKGYLKESNGSPDVQAFIASGEPVVTAMRSENLHYKMMSFSFFLLNVEGF